MGLEDAIQKNYSHLDSTSTVPAKTEEVPSYTDFLAFINYQSLKLKIIDTIERISESTLEIYNDVGTPVFLGSLVGFTASLVRILSEEDREKVRDTFNRMVG